jgi:uncharacterized membrane protein HdeD (DUF308 family)
MFNPMTDRGLDREAAEQISKSWWVLLLAGLVAVVAGIVILEIEWTVEDLALFVAILFIIRGIFRAVEPPMDGGGRGWNIAVGLLEMVVGIAFLVWPGPTLLVLAIFIGSWILVSGIFEIVGAISARHEFKMWWLVLIVGIIQVPLGLALLSRPVLTLQLAIVVAGVWAVMVGVLQIVLAFEVKRLPKMLDRAG